MSLLSETMTACTMITETITDDSYGGTKPIWIDGKTFNAAITLLSSNEVISAQKKEVEAKYNVITERDENLQHHDVFRRETDGKIFRVTKNGDDDKTPESAGLNMRLVTAEEWKLPNE